MVFGVQSYSDFASANLTVQLDQDGDPIDTTVAPDGSGAVTVVRQSLHLRLFGLRPGRGRLPYQVRSTDLPVTRNSVINFYIQM